MSDFVTVLVCEGGFCVEQTMLRVERKPFLAWLLPVGNQQELTAALDWEKRRADGGADIVMKHRDIRA